jgi:hypothetical protein
MVLLREEIGFGLDGSPPSFNAAVVYRVTDGKIVRGRIPG